ncbi:hypothetical protein CHRY9390_01167 [Chryseobacterium aquaeductus]|uniref:Methyltransferase FkbM domain-containing protein n=1 Tax=Chryseobacterium aquaeductus TaxID=2675056 RepID=A0A9N8MEU5_9FLAO|nr:FkbM family methyltransferase [Chryseobacterium aquaeductus]CAA7330496.1 hypothetical protein CHRY9390_01167 [Chryseobacterium potabilaquae]CAD7804044.1 hypothetical protein CHRY9390_01167 [Chryseobacterium aquaeductus]
MNTIEKLKNIIFKEGIYNYVRRKMNISYLDSKTTYKIKYRGNITKIVLNRAFGYVDMKIFTDGIYEKEIVDDIVNHLSIDKIMLDIGSNIGQHSLLSSRYCKQIYAFEPMPTVFNQFNESIRKNNIKNIETFNIGIGDKKEDKEFYFIKNHAGASSFIDRKNSNTEKILLKIDTLKNILGNTKFDVVKIDVEGFEAVVILGNKEIILKNRPVIFLEFDRPSIENCLSYSSNQLFEFFIENKFVIYSRKLSKDINFVDFQDIHQDNWIIKPL